MNLLTCTDWKVFFFRKPPKEEWVGGRGRSKWRDLSQRSPGKVEEEKEEKLPVKRSQCPRTRPRLGSTKKKVAETSANLHMWV